MRILDPLGIVMMAKMMLILIESLLHFPIAVAVQLIASKNEATQRCGSSAPHSLLINHLVS